MTIQDYIKKHSLTLWREYPDFKPEHSTGVAGSVTSMIASVFIAGDTAEFSHTDKFQIFCNAEKTRFVSINTSASLFRIIHADLILISSPWEPTSRNYVLHSPAVPL